jgi:hypothetical protein
MIHQTSAADLKIKLAGMPSGNACSLGKEYSSGGIGFKESLFKITIYGLGEQKEKNGNASAANEKLYSPLRAFWDCFWTQKGLQLPDSEFRLLSSFGESE